MPNNANPIQATAVAFQTYLPITAPTQQPFGNVSTMINTFFTNVSFPVTNSVGSFLVYGTTTSGTSSVEISDYNNHSFQFGVSGSGTASLIVNSTIDGWNFTTDSSSTLITTGAATSSLFRFTGRRRYFQVLLNVTSSVSASAATASIYLISGQ
jgi:hypothetical protein